MIGWYHYSSKSLRLDWCSPVFVIHGNQKSDARRCSFSWSDVIYLSWLHHCASAQEMRRLRFVIRVQITNKETTEVVAAAVGSERRLCQQLRCPGQFFMEDDCSELVQILGTVHGAGVAHLVFQHREALAKTGLREIRVWQTPNEAEQKRGNPESRCEPTMMFELEPKG